jgi:hypothetical protein
MAMEKSIEYKGTPLTYWRIKQWTCSVDEDCTSVVVVGYVSADTRSAGAGNYHDTKVYCLKGIYTGQKAIYTALTSAQIECMSFGGAKVESSVFAQAREV